VLVYLPDVTRAEGRGTSFWFWGLTITLEDYGDTLLTGLVVDQATLHGLLKKVCDCRTAIGLGQSCSIRRSERRQIQVSF